MGVTCGYIGSLVYAECPFGFYVSAAEISQIRIQVQPGDSVAGEGLARFPILILTDAYGNRKAEGDGGSGAGSAAGSGSGEDWGLTVQVHPPDLPSSPSTRLNRQIRPPDDITLDLNISSDVIEFANSGLRDLIRITQAASGYSVEFILRVEPPFHLNQTNRWPIVDDVRDRARSGAGAGGSSDEAHTDIGGCNIKWSSEFTEV